MALRFLHHLAHDLAGLLDLALPRQADGMDAAAELPAARRAGAQLRLLQHAAGQVILAARGEHP
ncbi:hypothetical protein D9M72_314050 [compost metagenome]